MAQQGMQVLGIRHAVGSFKKDNSEEVIAYDNLVLHVAAPYDPARGFGLEVEQATIKMENVLPLINKDLGGKVENLVNKQVLIIRGLKEKEGRASGLVLV